jgi:hypothetical protein
MSAVGGHEIATYKKDLTFSLAASIVIDVLE